MKDFDNWNILKQNINNKRKAIPFYKIRQIWWCNLGTNIGVEEDGKGSKHLRPVLIFYSFGRKLCWVIPLTTSYKLHLLRIPVGKINGKFNFALISQLRPIDTKRLYNRIGIISNHKFDKIKKALKNLFKRPF